MLRIRHWKAREFSGSATVCRMATRSYNLANFLEDPTQCCFFAEATAGPDLVVALENNNTTPKQKGFAFFQFKLREKVNKAEALRTTEWQHFYCNRAKGTVLSGYEDRAVRVKTAMQKMHAFGVVVAFPYDPWEKPKQANFRWCGESQLRNIFGDEVVDFLAALKTAQQLDFAPEQTELSGQSEESGGEEKT